MDEIGINLVYKLIKVIVKKGIKILYGKILFFCEFIIVIVCVNVGGGFLLFYFVFLGKMKRKLESYDFEVVIM